MKDLTHRVCATCGKHRGRKLWRFEGAWYCREHWTQEITWHETRGNLIAALATGGVCGVSVTRLPDARERERRLREARRACDRAAFHLKYGARQEFVREIICAMWALEGT